MQKPILPKGTRDFNSEELYKRNYIINIIKDNFLKFGFNPIETPSFERSETLLGKYGQEGERLIFKILKSGDFLKDTNVDENCCCAFDWKTNCPKKGKNKRFILRNRKTRIKKYIIIKNADAPVECIYLISQPIFTSRIINSTESKAICASGL